MTLTELDVLKVIGKLEGKESFIRSNIRRTSPSFSEIWNLLLFERIAENPKPTSFKTMTHRLLKKAVAEGKVTRTGKYYTLSEAGKALINLEDRRKVKIQGAYNTGVMSSIVYTPGPLIGDHGNLDGDKLQRLMKRVEEIIEEEEVPRGTKIVLKVEEQEKRTL
jgi:DNA-binding PadR family transcriptional regulator